MANLKQLKKAAAEINELPGFDTGIDLDGGEDVLIQGIKEASDFITDDDELSDATRAIIAEVTAEPAKKEVAKPAKGKAIKKVVVEEVEPEDEPEEEVEVNVYKFVQDATTLKELKEIAKTYPEFEDVDLKIKDIDELREEMLNYVVDTDDMLEAPDDDEEVPEEKPAKKAVRKVVEEAKPAAKAKTETKVKSPAGSKGTLTKERIAFISPFIEKGKYTKVQLIEMLAKKFPDASATSFQTLLTDCKNPKYNQFPKLVVQSADGLYKFGK
jgi:hypothetical protein